MPPSHQNHLFVLDELLRLAGVPHPVPRSMFPRRWPSRRDKLAHVFYGSASILRTLLSTDRNVILHSSTDNLVHGEIWLSDRDIRMRALRSLCAGKPFLIARSDEPAPLRRACSLLQIDPAEALKVYVSVNSVPVFFASKDGADVVAHVASSEIAFAAVRRHRQGLQVLATAGLTPRDAALVPKEAVFHEQDGYQVLAQTRLAGSTRHFAHSTDQEMFAALHAALQAIVSLAESADSGAAGLPDDAILHQDFPALVRYRPELAPLVQGVLPRLQQWQRTRGLKPVLTHGDYWVRNALFAADGTVSGIIDWEWARLDGTPGLDALHLAFMTLVMDRDRDILDYIAQVWRRRYEHTLLEEYVAAVRTAYRLTEDDLDFLAGFLLLDELRKLKAVDRAVSPERLSGFLALQQPLDVWLARQQPQGA